MTRHKQPNLFFTATAIAAALGAATASAQPADKRSSTLEEVIVTAQKRAETLQEAPISIAAFGTVQLQDRGISGLGDMGAGVIPSLRIQPFPNTPTTLTISVRGAGFSDAGQVTFEPSVAIYLDDVYLSRAQGLAMEIADLERIEVLRGPQGTLFGRNATGGAVRMISKKPTGEFGLRQTFTAGNYSYFKSVTHVDLPEIAGVKTKLDYLHSEKDGWVDNTAAGENDPGDSEQDAFRFAADWNPIDNLNVFYAYDWSDAEVTNLYYQIMFDQLGVIGVEKPAADKTRIPVRPLDPTVTKQTGHNLTLTWDMAENLTLKSISAYRDLEEETRNNYAGALLFNGLITAAEIDQDQFSQELQLLGEAERIKWIGGLYYYEESAREDLLNLASLDSFGALGYGFFAPIYPPILQPSDARRIVKTETESWAAFGQATWTPPVLEDRLEITVGARYTEDKKKGSRDYPLPALVTAGSDFVRYNINTDSFDPTVTFSYQWTEQLNTYLRWANGYKAGGVNQRSFTFISFDEEKAETWELGLKSEFFDRRARLNLAVFQTEYDDFQIGFQDPVRPTFSETINATRTTEISGLELELTVVPLPGLTVDLSYTYLDGDQPDQPNPVNNNIPERFELEQTPNHAGSLGIDYEFNPFSFGVLSLHVDVISSASYAYTPKNFAFHDSYTLVNGRITLSEIAVGPDQGNLRVALWGKNLTDEEYRTYVFPVGNPVLTIPASYGEPTTYGLEVEYQY
ncbi:MAG TPA: TonB-dependent receptor [Spongiibacteraceae bacterium]|nr:TonB-dependent receptor [Spongiibacteraceae bacterium]